MKFSHTEEAAKIDKRSKWDLIAAIALDAMENDVEIVSGESILAAKAALDKAGDEHADSTVHQLCVVAKFDHESDAKQRRVWRRYGWTVVRVLAQSGWEQDVACDFLMGSAKSKRDVEAEVRRRAGTRTPAKVPGNPEIDLDAALVAAVNRLDAILTEFASLAERAETENVELSNHAQLALLIYERITERKIDAELRDLMESEGVQS